MQRYTKGFIPYSTKELIIRIENRMDGLESYYNRRICPINGRWMLQIRGKDLRRVLKKRPNWRQQGRCIVDMEYEKKVKG